MTYRIEYAGIDLGSYDGQTFTFSRGDTLLDVLAALPGTVEYRPPTPQERFEDVCRDIREQRYVLLRDPHGDDDWG